MEDPDERRPVVFLDVDGVLCLDGGQQTLEPLAMQALKRLCEEIDADVVLSTDWRRDAALADRLEQALAEIGIRCICLLYTSPSPRDS